MRTVTKKELTDRIADALDAKRTLVKQVVQRFLDEIIAELAAGNRLEFRDFGVFEVRTRKPRLAQNPRTLQRVPVPHKATVKFKVGRRMKLAVQPLAQKMGNSAEGHVEAPPLADVEPSSVPDASRPAT